MEKSWNCVFEALCSFVQDMSNNELTTLPKAIGYLCKIIKLNVANNQLQSLPAEIGTMNGINRLKPIKRSNAQHLVEYEKQLLYEVN